MHPLDGQARLQLRADRQRSAWLASIAAIGLAFSVLGAVTLERWTRDSGWPSGQAWLFAGGCLLFGYPLVHWSLWAVLRRGRLVPCFARELGTYGGPSSAAFHRGRALHVHLERLDAIARERGVAPLLTFGFEDDSYGQTVEWHLAADGLATVAVLKEEVSRSEGDGPLAGDLAALATALGAARDAGTEFCLLLRLGGDSVQAVALWEPRAGRFW